MKVKDLRYTLTSFEELCMRYARVISSPAGSGCVTPTLPHTNPGPHGLGLAIR
jgi:hypothetical protein